MYGKSCKYCVRGVPVPLTKDILCRQKGIVSSGYICPKYKPSPTEKTPRELNYKCSECKNFSESISLSGRSSTIGTCILFCTRPFEANMRSACKRFELRKIREIM